MKKQPFLRNLSALLSSAALFAAISCAPVPYPQGSSAYQGPNSSRAIAGNDVGRSSAIRPPSTAYQNEPQERNNQSYNSTRTYTPPSQRPSYTPPAQRPTYQPPAPPTLPSTTARASNSSVPMATPSIKADTVISPYPPYNVLSTIGASSGDKLCDPSTIPIDPSTGKQYVNASTGQLDVKRGKYFIVP